MNDQGPQKLPSFGFTPSQLSLYYPNLVNTLKIFNQQNPNTTLIPIDPTIHSSSVLEKRSIGSLDSAFSRLPEKKVHTTIKENILNAMLQEVNSSAPNPLTVQTARDQVFLQEQVSKALVNQLQFEMNKLKEINTLLTLNQSLNQNLLLKKMAIMNNNTQTTQPLSKMTLEVPKLPEFSKVKEEPQNKPVPPVVVETKEAKHKEPEVSPQHEESTQSASSPKDKLPMEYGEPEGERSPVNIEPPALIEFTKDFPTWDLAKIFAYVGKGKTKDDLVVRTTREKSKRPSYARGIKEDDIEHNSWDEKSVNKKPKTHLSKKKKSEDAPEESKKNDLEVLCEFQEDLQKLFKTTELDQQKIFEVLQKFNMNPEKAISAVIKNLSYYQETLILNKSAL